MGVTVVVDDVDICRSDSNILVVFEYGDDCCVHHHETIVIQVLDVFFLLSSVRLWSLFLLLLVEVLFFFRWFVSQNYIIDCSSSHGMQSHRQIQIKNSWEILPDKITVFGDLRNLVSYLLAIKDIVIGILFEAIDHRFCSSRHEQTVNDLQLFSQMTYTLTLDFCHRYVN